MQIHLFGAATPSGEALSNLVFSASDEWVLKAYSRRPDIRRSSSVWADFSDPAAFIPAGDGFLPSIWISFGPIWLLAPFLEILSRDFPERLEGLQCLIACSSSSTITKRFASNSSDRELVSRLIRAEDQLLSICRTRNIPCYVLRPTLIYGQVGSFSDRNLSLLLQHMRRWPLLPLPAETGLRQPIHASQLASVAFTLAQQFKRFGRSNAFPERIALGGDDQLTYAEMLEALQLAQAASDPARRCRLISVPNRLFLAAASPLLLFSPKAFEAVLRICADLAGFPSAHQLIGDSEQSFPLPSTPQK